MTRHPAKSIIQAVSQACGVPVELLVSKHRHRPVSQARMMAAYLMRSHVVIDSRPISYPQIASRLGGRDHTTAMHAVETFPTLLVEKTHMGAKAFAQMVELQASYQRAREILEGLFPHDIPVSGSLTVIARQPEILDNKRAKEVLSAPAKALTKPAYKEQVNG